MDGFGKSQNSTHSNIRSYFNGKEHLWLEDGIIMFKNRIVIPRSLRLKVLRSLHSAHQGTEGMRARASSSVYWPGMNASIAEIRKNCRFCDSIAPTQPRQPLQPLPASEYPFQYVCADAFELHGHQYLVIVDKFSGWLNIFHFKVNIRSKHIVDALRSVFHTYGVPVKLYSDGGLAFASQETNDFLKRWGVEHIVSSAHYPQSNGRAELAVKTAKRIISENVSPDGSLNTEATSRSLLQYRNTPIQGVGLSPAQILYHRTLRDSIPTHPSLLKPHKQWLIAAQNREEALRERNLTQLRRYNTFTKDLRPLAIGDTVLVQDHGHRKRWHKSGTIVEKRGRSYTIRMDGSSRVVTRNRRFIKPITSMTNNDPITSSSLLPYNTATTANTPEPQDSTITISGGEDAVSTPNEDTSNISVNSEIEDTATGSTSSPATKDPLMLRRLKPHNNPGYAE